jgi:hypothetical protein
MYRPARKEGAGERRVLIKAAALSKNLSAKTDSKGDSQKHSVA